jgi:hypothetical protein
MTKITNENWFLWLCGVLATCFLISGLFMSIISKGIESSEAAGWVQAVGAIIAIIAAGRGIKSQLKAAEEASREHADHELQNTIGAIKAELGVYENVVRDVKDKIDNDIAVPLHEITVKIFLEITPRFVVFRANASHIGKIPDENLRKEIIAIYAELEVFFLAINKNSAILTLILNGEKTPDEAQRHLKALLPVLQEQARKLIELFEIAAPRFDECARPR